ncbi:hypothetical protein HYC85_018300 [Camellia sinensis]|uniref:Uncharacterized protein n=1 Tax=Camellia sinensis TaxID=4442 RepID=A0A7J7GTY5_CAMSI|nr:hypothetical protein HYC85_018300 [Camellia sinensis]
MAGHQVTLKGPGVIKEICLGIIIDYDGNLYHAKWTFHMMAFGMELWIFHFCGRMTIYTFENSCIFVVLCFLCSFEEPCSNGDVIEGDVKKVGNLVTDIWLIKQMMKPIGFASMISILACH